MSCCKGLEGPPLLKIVRPMSDANLRGLRYSAVLNCASGLRTPRRCFTKAQSCMMFRDDVPNGATGEMSLRVAHEGSEAMG